MWDAQLPLLTRTHRVVRYDTRGHGQSSAPEGPYSFDILVGDMLAVLDHVGAPKADVLGLSLGGMTALGLGLRYPERVGRMIVCSARADNPPPFVTSWDERISAIEKNGMEAIVDGTLARWFTEACPPAPREKARKMILATSVTGFTGCARALQKLHYLKFLPEMTVPVRYLVGSEDMGAPKDTMAAMAEATPNSEFTILPRLAHIINMQDPEMFDQAVAPWLRLSAQEHNT